jgi:hypothetical protein
MKGVLKNIHSYTFETISKSATFSFSGSDEVQALC